jgi:tetratricopeptide (TPR) repeat protein
MSDPRIPAAADARSTERSDKRSVSQLPSELLETGLITLHSMFTGMQRAVAEITGQKSRLLKDAPINGPQDVDNAVSDFVGRFAEIARRTPLEASEVGPALRQLANAGRSSFAYLDLVDPRNIFFPAQLALSMGSLAVQSALRGLATYGALGQDKFQKLIPDFFELFQDFPVFIQLEYDELLNRLRKRVAAAPGDIGARLELGRTLLKCGLYDDAERELLRIPKGSSQYAAALHDLAVALVRAGRFERGADFAVKSLHENPGNERTQFWLWLAAQKLGAYPSFVPQPYRMTVKAGYARPTVEFEDIGAKIGLDKTSGGRGTAIFDYDNDGRLDIVIASAHGGCSLYHNNGDGTFTDVSVGSGLDTCVNGFGVVAADYNNDGLCDVFVGRLGFYPGDSVLFRNNGDGTFTDVTKEAGVQAWGPAFAPSWVDYDCDGFLDLFIPNNLGGLFERKTPNRLFHNNGDGTFTDVTEKVGLNTIWPTIGAAFGDYDNDGYPDLFVSNAIGRSQLFHNNGDGTFTDVSEKAGITALGFGSVSFWWDYDNDGWLDLAQFEWSDHEDVLYTLKNGKGPSDGNPMRVFHNNRDGTFTQMNETLGLNGCWGTMSGNAGDFNNDGHLDLVLGNGSPKMERSEPATVLEYQSGQFQNVTFAAGFPITGKSHGVNMADLFGDGRLSVLIGAGGAYPGDLLTVGLYCPKSLPGNYLNLRLIGTQSNRSAIGARICLHAGGRKQFRLVSGGSNFGCLPLEQHFGLGDIAGIDAIEVRWPNGLNQRFEGLEVNNTYEFTEGRPGATEVYSKPSSSKRKRVK